MHFYLVTIIPNVELQENSIFRLHGYINAPNLARCYILQGGLFKFRCNHYLIVHQYEKPYDYGIKVSNDASNYRVSNHKNKLLFQLRKNPLAF